MDRLRAAVDEVVEKVKMAIQGEPKNPVEILLDEHLPAEPDFVTALSPKASQRVAIPTFVMNDFASRTNNVVDYMFIMDRIWEIITEAQQDPFLLRKALNLLHYLLINGSIQVLKDCQDPPRLSLLQHLSEDYNRYEVEQYHFSKNLDIGAGVRKVAADIAQLLTDERDLFRLRRKAETMNKKLSDRGLRSSYPAAKGESPAAAISVSGSFDTRPPRYSEPAPFDGGIKIITHADEAFLNEMGSTKPDSRDSSRNSSRNGSRSKNEGMVKPPEPTGRKEADLLGLDTILLGTDCGNNQSGSRISSSRLQQKLIATI
ncbi:TPA: hypothetical protein N0F65_009978 [Lagenidium giganteum]|uniref:ENTH domain-containing protein n=1 Tax=Lagenidium giganteum TaxID=4803 RepID=A0AAV2ZGJ7_9STRA|nr:TPA: hypothetical protein N0F65_009978 [Lagenidium giganteum]